MSSSLYTAAYKAFVAVVRDVRVEQGLSQSEVAARMGQPQSFLSKSERRERRIDVVEFIALARALQVAPDVLLARVAEAVDQAGGPGRS